MPSIGVENRTDSVAGFKFGVDVRVRVRMRDDFKRVIIYN